MDTIKQTIHAKIVELARGLGRDARGLGSNAEIPASGLLDSAALMELIMWCEMEFGIEIEQEQLTLDNFGSVDAIAAYVEGARK
jgi:D-alanine--poly(phosphoribitol) ligase subunit 2